MDGRSPRDDLRGFRAVGAALSYLLGLGIGESIMSLMRSAPPTGIHWMTPTELAATRIATDTTEARTLV